MNSIDYLVGTAEWTDEPLPVFSEEAVAFCAALSERLMRSPALRAYPDLAALAFWCRRAHLQKLKEAYPDAPRRLGRGRCFHLAPGNMPVNFAFSYLFGLLAGCSNLVRLSARPFPQVDPLCEAVSACMAAYPEVAKRTAFVRYGHDDAVTARFCAEADARMIWGGDATIAALRAMPVPPRCVDVCFADRYSVCLLDGEAVLRADAAALSRLIDGFYNDTYLMDQNACSSPQTVFWLHDRPAARERFWDALHAVVREKYRVQAAAAADNYAKPFEEILDGVPLAAVERRSNALVCAPLTAPEGDLTRFRGRGGYFHEISLTDLAELAAYVNGRFQTVTYFGVDPDAVRHLVVERRLRGIDRVVPVGRALEIGLIWDGFDLIRTLSRVVGVD